MATNRKVLAKLYMERREIDEAINQALARECPVGSAITWMRGGHLCHGTIVSNGYHDRVRVQNDLTKTVYWIDLGDIVRAFRSVAA